MVEGPTPQERVTLHEKGDTMNVLDIIMRIGCCDTSPKKNTHVVFNRCFRCFMRWNSHRKIGPEPQRFRVQKQWYTTIQLSWSWTSPKNKTDVERKWCWIHWKTWLAILSILGQSHWQTHSFKKTTHITRQNYMHISCWCLSPKMFDRFTETIHQHFRYACWYWANVFKSNFISGLWTLIKSCKRFLYFFRFLFFLME